MAQEQILEQPKRRRIRTTTKRAALTGNASKAKLDKLTQEMRDAQATMQRASRELKAKADEAFALMQDAKITSHVCAEGDLKIKVPSGRSSTYIGAKAFHKLVDDDEFYEAVKVSVTEARKVLSGKEIKEIAEVTPATPGAPALKYEFYFPEGTEEDA